MKFSIDNMVCKQEMEGFKVWEPEDRARFPLDGAYIKAEKCKYPPKINHGFYELFYIIKGTYFLNLNGEEIVLNKGDFYILEPEIKHSGRADYAEMVVVCNPPFDIKNCEFLCCGEAEEVL